MNRFLTMLFLGAASAALPIQAAVARTYPDALSRAGHKPIVLFCYGANTDKYNEECYDKYIKRRAINDALRTCMFVEVPMYQFPDPRQKKEMDSIIGPKGLPSGIYTIPSLAVVDSRGNLRGIVQDSADMQNPEKAKAALKKILEAFDTQEDLIVKAEKAGGARKSKIYMEAANVKGVTMPPLAGADLGKNKGKAGQVKAELENRSKFDPLALVESLQTMDLGSAESYVRGMLNQGYSIEQRQMMLAALGGHVRRNKGSVDKMRQIYTEMRDLDPDAPYGAYAQGALDLWVDKKDTSVAKLGDIPAEITRTGNVISTVGSGKAAPGANDMPTIPVAPSGGKTAMGTASAVPSDPQQPDTQSMEDE